MPDSPLVSVVTVTYNAEPFLEKTLRSVQEQTCDSLEHIVIDGGSKDGTVGIIRAHADRIAYWTSEPDRGIFDAMNKGIAAARGTWVNFMNAGDAFYGPDAIENARLTDRAEAALVYGDTFEYGRITRAYPVETLRYGIILAVHQSMFFNRKVLGAEFYYPAKHVHFEDYELVNRIYLKYPDGLRYSNSVIAEYQGGGVSASASWDGRFFKYRTLLRHYGPVGVLRGILHRVRAGTGSPGRA